MLRTRLVAGVTSGFVLSAVFATGLTVVQFGETFIEPWRVDPAKPAPITLRLPRTTLRTGGEAGTIRFENVHEMVGRGEVIRDAQLATLVRVYERERRPPSPANLGAQWFVYFLLVMLATSYMRRSSSSRGGLLRTQVGIFALTFFVLLGAKFLLLATPLSALLVPVGLIPLWAALYVDRRTGVMLSLATSVMAASLISYDPIALAVYLIASSSAALAITRRKRPARLLWGGLVAALGGALVYIATKQILDGVEIEREVRLGLYSGPASAGIGGLASGLLALALQAPVAAVFGVVSRGQLLNLTDLDQPLLQRMAREAPGSWEHSRAMANLAEAAAASISADALLTRVGAYYHDLGKSCQSKYYIENLEHGEESPHNHLEPDVSADAIMAHVVEGVRILREGGIPEPVVEFSYTHHGTGLIEYFWHKCKEQGNPKGLTEDAFRYPGMRPRTKETAILMLIDAIEAGARTVQPPSKEGFRELVQRVIFTKLEQGQLDESELDIQELRILSTQIVDTLCSAYHARIRYPWQETKDRAEAEASGSRPNGATASGETTADGDGPSPDSTRDSTPAPPMPSQENVANKD